KEIGKTIWGIGIAPKGDVIAFQDQRNPDPKGVNNLGTGKWRLFDLVNRKWLANPWQPPPAVESAGGWHLLTGLTAPKTVYSWNAATKVWQPHTSGPGQRSIYTWYVEGLSGKVYVLPLPLPGRAAEPTCYTFLPAKGG